MKSTATGLGGPQFPVIDSNGTVAITDSDLLLSGSYSRDGDDLVLTGTDGQQLQIVDYFSQSSPPALISSDGRMLSGDTVSLLAGPQAPGQYAQSTGGQFGEAIGQVESISGTASAQRSNGLTVELEVGSAVFQGDVVSAGANSTLGITFIDKTVFTIDNGARMVLNEMVYSPAGTSNSMLFNLLGGTAAFVAGAIANTGEMKIETPVAVMAIRGTWPFVGCDLVQASCYFGGESGVYDLLHKTLGRVIATVDNPAQIVTLNGIDGAPSIGGPDAAQKEAMGQLFQTLRGTLNRLEQRLDDGEDPVRETNTGSPDFADVGFLGDMSGIGAQASGEDLSRTAETLLEPTSLQQETTARGTTALPPLEELSRTIDAALTDEDTSTTVDVFTGSEAINPTPTIISAFITSGLGAVSISADGKSILYDPGLAYNSLSAGETAKVLISLLIDLGDGTTRTDEATVTVEGVNDLPSAEADTAAANEGTMISIDVLANDTDPDTNDELMISQAAVTSGLGAVVIAADGRSIVYDTAGAYDHLSADETAKVVITYEVSDGEGGVSSATATVTVSGLNDLPFITAADTGGQVTERADGSGGENAVVLASNGLIQFIDVDINDHHQVTVTPGNEGYRGSLTATVAGTGGVDWRFTVKDADLDDLAAGQTLEQIYTIAIDDGNGGVVTQDVRILVRGANDAPEFSSGPGDAKVTEDSDDEDVASELTARGVLEFGDVDLSDSHSISIEPGGGDFRGALSAVISDPSQGDGNGEVSWKYIVDNADLDDLAAGTSLLQDYTITLTDLAGASVTQTVTIRLNGSNDAAMISGTSAGSVVAEDTDKTVDGLLSVVDPDVRPDGTSEAAFNAAVIAGTYGSLAITAGGAWSYTLDNNAAATQALLPGAMVIDSFTVSSVDGTTQPINITVQGQPADLALSDFSESLGVSDVKLFTLGTIESIDIDLLVTAVPLISTDDGVVFNEVQATESDLGTGIELLVDTDEGLRFEILSQSEADASNSFGSLTYESHISLVLFQAQVNDVSGGPGATASLELRIVNALDDNNFDSQGGSGDKVLTLNVADVSVMIAPGNNGNFQVQQLGDSVVVTGLQQGDTFTIDSPTPFNRVEVENASEAFGGNDFALGVLGFNMPDGLMLTGDGSTEPLIGAASNDTLNSGPGQQELTGGKGVDVFVFDGNASTGALADIIIDYEENVDVIDLTGLFKVASGAFNEGAADEYVRYLSPKDDDGSGDPARRPGDLFIDEDGAANGENFVLLAHLNAATDNLIIKVEDVDAAIGYVTIV